MQLSKASLLPTALLFSAASADIWIGIASGQYQCGNSGAGPQQCGLNQWIRMIAPEAGDICEYKVGTKPDGFPHVINDQPSISGDDTWNLCGISLCPGADVVMGEGGNCGAGWGQMEVPDGEYYATLYDRYNNNEPVGECVYEMGESDNCGEVGGSILAHTWLHCYTDACDNPDETTSMIPAPTVSPPTYAPFGETY